MGAWPELMLCHANGSMVRQQGDDGAAAAKEEEEKVRLGSSPPSCRRDGRGFPARPHANRAREMGSQMQIFPPGEI